MGDRGSFSATQIAFFLAQDEVVRWAVRFSGAPASAHKAVPEHDVSPILPISEQKDSIEEPVSEISSTMAEAISCLPTEPSNALCSDSRAFFSKNSPPIFDLTVAQTALLTCEQVHALSTAQLASMSAEQADALTAEQLSGCAWDEAQLDAWVAALDS